MTEVRMPSLLLMVVGMIAFAVQVQVRGMSSSSWVEVTSAGSTGRVRSSSLSLDILTELSENEFRSKYKGKKPFVLKNLDIDRDKFSIHNLMNTFPRTEFQVGKSKDISLYSGGKGANSITLEEMVTLSSSSSTQSKKRIEVRARGDSDITGSNAGLEPLYIFDRNNVMESPNATRLLAENVNGRVPPFFSINTWFENKYIIIGRPGSGVTLHQHEEAWAYLASGTKKWFLFNSSCLPPLEYPVMRSQRSWMDELLPQILELSEAQHPIIYTQRAGEMMYIPELWYHGTMVMSGSEREHGLSVAFAFQSKIVETLWGWSLKNITQSLSGEDRKSQESNKRALLEGAAAARKTLAYQKKHTGAHYMLAVTLMRAGEFKKAFYAVKEAIRLTPNLSDLYLMLSEILIGLKRPHKAVRAVKRALQLNPLHRGGLLMLADRLKSTGAIDDAFDVLEQLSELLSRSDPMQKVVQRKINALQNELGA